MTKINILCDRLIKEHKVELYDTLSYNYPQARIDTLNTGKGHPVVYKDHLAPTVKCDGGGAVVMENNKKLIIRKLTELEVMRLMGFDDEDYHKIKNINSSSQIYKQCGNSIVVNCLMCIFKNLFNLDTIKTQ